MFGKLKLTWKRLFTIGVVLVYIAMIVVLIVQSLTPGNESSNISNSVGNKIDEVITEIQKPETERIDVSGLTIDSLIVSGETISVQNPTMKVGTTGKLGCTVSPSDASNKSLLYASSDSDTVTVYSDGRVEAKKAGAAVVTVTSEDNRNVHTAVTITVTGVLPEEIRLTLTATELYPEKTYGLDIEYIPSNTTERELEWSSSDPNVLTVSDSGQITTLAEGTAVVTATSKTNADVKASVSVTVVPVPEPERISVSGVKIKSVKVSGETLSVKDLTIKVGATGKLNCTVSPSDASNKSLVYVSSANEIVTVYADGTIEALKAGEAVITVTSEDDANISDSVTITVGEVAVESIKISTKSSLYVGQSYALYVGQSYGLDITYTPTNTTQRGVTWKSSDTSVLTVSSSGKIKGKAEGTVVVTATSKANGNVTVSITVTVKVREVAPAVPVEALSIAASGEVGYVGASETISYTITPENATDKDLVWSSSDESVAAVDQSGTVTYLKAGTVTITAKCSSYDVEDSVTITVKEVLSQTITLDMEGLTEGSDGAYSMKIATAATLHAILDENATILSVVYASSAPSVARIGQDGVIEAVSKGTTTITASTSYDGETVSTSFLLTVLSLTPDVERIKLVHEHEYGYVGSGCTLTATIFPEDATDSLTWSSSDTQIATVTQGGKVTYLKAGVVTITAKCSSYDVKGSITVTVKEVLSKNIQLVMNGLSETGDGGYSLKIATSAEIGAILDAGTTVLTVTYTSSAPEIAKIGQDGVIEAVSDGTVTITVSTSYDGETTSESFELTVIGYTFKDTMDNFYYWVRKSFGHFGAFLVLGIFATLSYLLLFPKSTKGKLLGFVVCIAAGFAVAGITEIFQLPIFTQGRSCSFDDVLLDFKGYCLSALTMYFVIFIVHFTKLFLEMRARKTAQLAATDPTEAEVTDDRAEED